MSAVFASVVGALCLVVEGAGGGAADGGLHGATLTAGLVLLLNGAVILPLSFTLLILGPALISAPEVCSVQCVVCSVCSVCCVSMRRPCAVHPVYDRIPRPV
jgi:hypothetical protein